MPRNVKHRPSAARSERRQAALRRRREDIAARGAEARRAARRARRRKVLAAVAVVAVAGAATAAGVALWPEYSPSARLRAAVVPGATGRLGVTSPPASYHAVYRVESYGKAKSAVATQEIFVRRPFDGRVVIRDGEPPGRTVKFDARSSYARYGNYVNPASPQVASEPPNVAVGDLRLDASLDDLVRGGLFVERERRRVLDRECQVYRTGSPLESLKVAAPTSADHADACVDQAGIVLEEVAVAAGKVTQHVTATEVTIDPHLGDDTFLIEGQAVGFDQGGAELSELDPASPPTAGYWQLASAPEGFTQRGRYLLKTVDTTSESGQTVSSWVDAYLSGTSVVLVQQGPDAALPTESPDQGPPVDLGPLGSAKVALGVAGSAVVAHPAQGSFVEVTGTLPADALRRLASALAPATPAP
jgi:hypothetical protein